MRSAAALCCALAACGGSTQTASSTSDGAVASMAPSDAAADVAANPPGDVETDAGDAPPDSSAPTVRFGGTVVASGSNSFPLSGAQVCNFQAKTCSTSDGQGRFSLELPANAEVVITIVRPGYTNVLLPITTTLRDQIGWTIGSWLESKTAAAYAAAGVTYPDTTVCFLGVTASPNGAELGESGVSFQFSSPPAAGPVYFDDMGVPAPALTATSTFSAGISVFPASTDQVTITFLPVTLSCTPNFGGWPAPEVNGVRVPLLPGFETHVGQRCLP